MQKKGKRRVRVLRLVLTVILSLAIGFVAWGYISPLLASGTETVYQSYTAGRGDIRTFKSFSASLNVLNSETHNNERQVASIRKLYVQSGQHVRDGDKLLQLDTGKIYRAGIDGVINEMRFGEGDWVWPNVRLVQICDLENLEVSLQVDEYDVDKVAKGQPCTVTIVALGQDFETVVKHVNRLSSATGNVAYYEVTADLTVPSNVLPGMTASVSIPAEEAVDAVTLDMAALSFDEDRQPYVLIQNGESYEKRMLETGLSDGMKVEIKSGLNEGDIVYTAQEIPSENEGFSLGAIYKHIAGETVVINDMSGGGRGGRGGMPPAAAAPEADNAERSRGEAQ